MSVANDIAHEMVRALVRRSLVLLTFSRQGERTPHHGSGTLLIGRGGRVGVLSAAHVVRPGDTVSLVTQHELLEDAVERVEHASDGLDIALAFVRNRTARRLVDLALPTTQLETRAECCIARGSLLVVGGFPAQFTYDVRHSGGCIQHRFVDMVNFSTDFGHDDRLISIRWKDGEFTGHEFPFEDLGVPRGRKIPLQKPSGVSGGPVFLIRRTRKNEIWAPNSDVTLVGVAIEYKDQRELALPWWRWSSWATQMLD
jgi:hypothetical protein